MLIGRDVELATCTAAVDAAHQGRGRALILVGEAGTGKTSLVQAAAERAVAQGTVVRWGACWEADPSPFGVWLDALRWIGDACAEVADAIDVDHPRDDELAAAHARRRFFDSVVSALRDVSVSDTQLLILEDLHWADEGSMELLRAVAPRLAAMRVAVLGTCRREELDAAAPPPAGGGIEAIEIHGLAEEAIGELLTPVLGRALTDDERRSLHRKTGGNPLFALELGRLLASGSPADVPVGVRDVLGRRLARLGPDCHDVLGMCATLGTEFDARMVAASRSQPLEEVLEWLEEARRHQLVTPVADRASHWRFAHELVRAVRYDALGTGQRLDLHRIALDLLEHDGSTAAAVLAHHASRSAFAPGDDRAARVALRAAREAQARHAWDDAVGHCTTGLASTDGTTDVALVADLWIALGDARLRTGGDAAAAFDHVAEIGRDRQDPSLIARAALGFGAGLGGFEVRLLDPHQIDLLEEAAHALPAEHPLLPLVLARLSVALSFVGSPTRRLELADRAVQAARDRADPRALAAALGARCDAMAGPDRVADRLAASTEAIAAARRAGDEPLELLGRRLRVVALLEARDLDGFDAEVARYARTAEHLGDPLYQWWVPLWRACRRHADGAIAEALDLVREAREIGNAGGSRNADLLCLVAELWSGLDRRDRAAVEAVWEALETRHPDVFQQEVAIGGMLVVTAVRVGDDADLRHRLRGFDRARFEQLPFDQEWLCALAQHVIGAVELDDPESAELCYTALLPYRQVGVFEGAAAYDHGVAERFLALGAACTGRLPEARSHAEAALAANAAAGRLLVAHTRADAALALGGGEPDDRARARELAAQAVATYRDIGLDAAADALEARFGPSPEVPPADPTAANAFGDASLLRDGDTWAITFQGSTVHVRHAKGIADLSVLLANPGQVVHVRTLEGVDHLDAATSHQAAIDETAARAYRDRLAELDAEIDAADLAADLGRAEKLRLEQDALLEELERSFGLGGRSRAAGSDPDERLRKAVSARVKASIARIEKLHPQLGRHLTNAVHTGYRCTYTPDLDVRWDVRGDRTS